MRKDTLDSPDRDQVLSDWKSTVEQLMDETEHWVAEQSGWTVSRSNKEITEELLGTYVVPVLEIRAPKGKLLLEPLARMVFGGQGTLELYAWPTLYRVRLIRSPQDQEWKILTDSGIRWPAPWNRENFYLLADELLAVNEG